MNFPFLDGDVPRSISYGVYISQLIHFARVSSHVNDLNTRKKVLTAKLSDKDIDIINFVRRFQNFVCGILTYFLNIMSDKKHFICNVFLNLNFMVAVYKFRKIIGKYDFPYHFKKLIVRYKNIGYNIDVLRQSACLVVNPIKVNNFAYLFDCTTVGQASD